MRSALKGPRSSSDVLEKRGQGHHLLFCVPGIDSGQDLRLAGQGGESPGKGPPGDLIVSVAVMEHPVFKRQGYDIHVEATISMTQVSNGHPGLFLIFRLRLEKLSKSEAVLAARLWFWPLPVGLPCQSHVCRCPFQHSLRGFRPT
jgi:hypothetical protein